MKLPDILTCFATACHLRRLVSAVAGVLAGFAPAGLLLVRDTEPGRPQSRAVAQRSPHQCTKLHRGTAVPIVAAAVDKNREERRCGACRQQIARTFIWSLLPAVAFAISSCSAPGSDIAQAQLDLLDQREVLAAQESRLRRVMVTVTARVSKLLPDDTKGIPHQRFLIRLQNGATVLIAHNTQAAPRVPVEPGVVVRIHGQYIWNEKGGVIHWTHHSNSPMHEGGWIELGGQRYE